MTGPDLHVSALSRGYLPAGLVTDDLCAGELPAILDFLVAAAAQRGGSLSIPVAWNCLALGYDLRTGQYSSEFLDWEALPVIALDDEIELLPTGALAAVRTGGGGQVPCEVVHREGDHPLLSPDGSCPAWLSGAPAGLDASPRHLQDLPEGPIVVPERLVLDAFAFGSERRQSLRRLTGRWLGAFGHLSVRTRYASPEQAEMPEARLYTSYLLTRQKPLLSHPDGSRSATCWYLGLDRGRASGGAAGLPEPGRRFAHPGGSGAVAGTGGPPRALRALHRQAADPDSG